MSTAAAIRRTKRELVQEFFMANLGRRISSSYLHATFGSAFRTRASDINKSDAPIIIRNDTRVQNGAESSWYWAERRKGQVEMFRRDGYEAE